MWVVPYLDLHQWVVKVGLIHYEMANNYIVTNSEVLINPSLYVLLSWGDFPKNDFGLKVS